MQVKVISNYVPRQELDVLEFSPFEIPRIGEFIHGSKADGTGYGRVIHNIVWKYRNGRLENVEIIVVD